MLRRFAYWYPQNITIQSFAHNPAVVIDWLNKRQLHLVLFVVLGQLDVQLAAITQQHAGQCYYEFATTQ